MRGFVSYAHDDRKVCEALRKPLKALCAEFDIEEFWIDDATPTGRCFRDGYSDAIARASIHVVLISSNSLWSDEIMDKELPAIHAKQARDGDLVLPVVVDDCLWQTVIGTLLASPRDAKLALKPVSKWKRMSEGINQIGMEFEKAIADHLGRPPKPRLWAKRP